MLADVYGLSSSGGTDIYAPTANALRLIRSEADLDKYLVSIILMTDGDSQQGSIHDVQAALAETGFTRQVPVFGILFGAAVEQQLLSISDLTNGDVYDGRHDLAKAFGKAKGNN